ncbi:MULTISPECIES: MarR family winged helix-turn-helix transcriptional regulator [Xanthomonas]|uniref:MarR family transcriptional regulator n=1 Tax=Xanthomonas cucurbitae TaxID=56453 RepID=A0A2S7DP94_9XANT|nr:helix-turn-helix domain-containing protein [Xanthomonas cucurbitae]PPU75658.1 MarR family transcriptional regulator [Xanthomonas cucurbitae]QHG88293.1 MarR family transcriptional regulator [Xanthomonas cucurbitae]WDM67147.1 MarR family transcriptional regulator [Xanthomonas cucurbitae]WDM71026.1 MarR family transcriptional regulator [Xanthomonas cucurbitae]WDM74859.1 MarR family transcriptional regulator [Xanthomonas cucurbitae]
MSTLTPTLGTLVRHLIELLDGDLEAVYAASGLAWRPRYTPVLRVLMRLGPASIKVLAQEIGITHSAASQTVAQMAKQRLVVLKPGADARERIVVLTAKVRRLVPALQQQWAATNAAAAQLDAELSVPLSAVLAEAIAALQRRSFATRITAATDPASRTSAP